MRTTVDIPDQLMKDVSAFYKGETKKSLIVKGLTNLVQKAACDGLIKAGGKYPNLKIDLDKLRGRDRYKRWQ